MRLSDSERVKRDGETFQIGDKVYGLNSTHIGVGTIEEIELLGVHFGFRALVDSTILNEPKWVDARNLTKSVPDKYGPILACYSDSPSPESSNPNITAQ